MQELSQAEIEVVAGSGWFVIVDAAIDFAKGFWQGAKDAAGIK